MNYILALFAAWLANYKYFLLFILVIFEGPLATVVAGFLTSQGFYNFFLAYLVAIFGDITGDAMWYGIAYYGNNKLLKRIDAAKKVNQPANDKIRKLFHDHTGKTLFIAKISHVLGLPVLLMAGMMKINFKKFLMYNFLATIFKSLIILFLGYYFFKAAEGFTNKIEEITVIALVFITIFIILYYAAGNYIYNRFFSNKNGS